MKNVIWASLLAVSAAMVAGCQGGEPATTPGTAQTIQAQVVESQQQQVARESCDPRARFMREKQLWYRLKSWAASSR